MRNLIFILLVLGLFGCNSKDVQNGDTANAETPVDTIAKIKNMQLGFDAPDRVDTSAYVMYKLPLSKTETADEGYGSSSRGITELYWNIAFYNVVTGQYHLLDDRRKMLITLSGGKDEDGSAAKINSSQTDTLLYYSVIVCDFNKDKKLDGDDPTYLFSSNKKGYNFRQISPDSLDVKNWEVFRSAGKILIHTTKDTNHDGKFNNDDENIPYVYDLHTGAAAKQVFDEAFKTKIKSLQHRLWATK